MDFDINQYLRERKALVEKHLFACLPKENVPQSLADAMEHALRAGGKRLRPILCLAASESVGGKLDQAIPAACAVEILHNYTLVHDDLPCMDNDTMRRGAPSVWAKYGETIGVLAGDALLTLAFETLARTQVSTATQLAELVRTLSQLTGAQGVIAGQVVDTQYDGKGDLEMVKSVFHHKTADLFCAACRLGGIAGGATAEQLAAIHSFAEHLGFAFQIEDDLLDAEEAKADDRPELSCLDFMSKEEARAWSEKETTQAIAALDQLPGETRPLRALATKLLTRKM